MILILIFDCFDCFFFHFFSSKIGEFCNCNGYRSLKIWSKTIHHSPIYQSTFSISPIFNSKIPQKNRHENQARGHLICTLISENQVLRNYGLFQTLEKFQFLHTWIFFQFVTWVFFQIYTIDLKKIQVTNWKKNSGVQELKFF